MDERRFAETLLETICALEKVNYNELLSRSRKRELVIVRVFITYYLFFYTKWGVDRIGEFLKRDHSSVNHYLNQIDDKFDVDPLLQSAYARTYPEVVELLYSMHINISWYEREIEKFRRSTSAGRSRKNLNQCSEQSSEERITELRRKFGYLVGDTTIYNCAET